MDWDAEADDPYPSPRPVAELGPDILAHGSGDYLGVLDVLLPAAHKKALSLSVEADGSRIAEPACEGR